MLDWTGERDIFTYFLVGLFKGPSSVLNCSIYCFLGSLLDVLLDMKASPSVVGSESMLLIFSRGSTSSRFLFDDLDLADLSDSIFRLLLVSGYGFLLFSLVWDPDFLAVLCSLIVFLFFIWSCFSKIYLFLILFLISSYLLFVKLIDIWGISVLLSFLEEGVLI